MTYRIRCNTHFVLRAGGCKLKVLAPVCVPVQHAAFALPPAGNTCQNGLMPALVRPILPAVQTSLAMKQFLPFPLDTASAVSLFPGFSAVSLLSDACLTLAEVAPMDSGVLSRRRDGLFPDVFQDYTSLFVISEEFIFGDV